MRRGIVVGILLLLLTFVFCANSYAENLYQMMGISLRGGAGFPSAGGMDVGPGVQASVSYGFNKYLNGEFEVGWEMSKWKNYGDIHTIPILFNLQLRAADLSENFVPYIVGGVGPAIVTMREKSAYSSDLSWGVALKGGLGFDYYVTPNWVLNAEGSYYFTTCEAKVNYKSGGEVVKHENQSFWFVGAGLKYYFEL